MPPDQTYSVVVPVYNSEQTLVPLVERIGAVMSAVNRPFEIILVNDGSSDASWGVVKKICAAHPYVRGICLMRNYGQHSALLAGIRAAAMNTIITMDDDLQHPPEEIPKLVSKLGEGHDVVYGTPIAEQHGLLRDLASQLTKAALSSVMRADIARHVSAFRIFRTRLREAFDAYRGPHPNIDVLLTWGTRRFGVQPVRHETRLAGKSNYTFTRLLMHAANMATGFSTLPLRIASIVGFAFVILGVLMLVYVFGRYILFGSTVAGFPFLASSIAMFSGVQLFCIGVMGEYIARIHLRSQDQPSYVALEVIPGDTAARDKAAGG